MVPVLTTGKVLQEKGQQLQEPLSSGAKNHPPTTAGKASRAMLDGIKGQETEVRSAGHLLHQREKRQVRPLEGPSVSNQRQEEKVCSSKVSHSVRGPGIHSGSWQLPSGAARLLKWKGSPAEPQEAQGKHRGLACSQRERSCWQWQLMAGMTPAVDFMETVHFLLCLSSLEPMRKDPHISMGMSDIQLLSGEENCPENEVELCHGSPRPRTMLGHIRKASGQTSATMLKCPWPSQTEGCVRARVLCLYQRSQKEAAARTGMDGFSSLAPGARTENHLCKWATQSCQK